MTEGRGVRLLLVDDHALFRAGVSSMLNARADIEVVGEAGSAEEALEVVRGRTADVALLDIGLPGMGGIALAERLRQHQPRMKVCMLSMHRDEEYLQRALKAGATGYVLKECSVDELAVAIQAVARGDTFISPRLSHLLVGSFLATAPDAAALTARQLEVLTLLAQGLSAKEVAFKLDLSTKTVETHRAQLMERLGLRSLAALVLYAVRHGLISADEGKRVD
jgi:DNA-binding NarL/FixJ family response regulator